MVSMRGDDEWPLLSPDLSIFMWLISMKLSRRKVFKHRPHTLLALIDRSERYTPIVLFQRFYFKHLMKKRATFWVFNVNSLLRSPFLSQRLFEKHCSENTLSPVYVSTSKPITCHKIKFRQSLRKFQIQISFKLTSGSELRCWWRGGVGCGGVQKAITLP